MNESLTTKNESLATTRITILVPKNRDYSINVERTGAYAEGKAPCCICGRGITDERATTFLHDIGGGGGEYLHPSCEPDYVADGADMGFYPVGPDCLRRNPALKEYVTRKE